MPKGPRRYALIGTFVLFTLKSFYNRFDVRFDVQIAQHVSPKNTWNSVFRCPDSLHRRTSAKANKNKFVSTSLFPFFILFHSISSKPPTHFCFAWLTFRFRFCCSAAVDWFSIFAHFHPFVCIIFLFVSLFSSSLSSCPLSSCYNCHTCPDPASSLSFMSTISKLFRFAPSGYWNQLSSIEIEHNRFAFRMHFIFFFRSSRPRCHIAFGRSKRNWKKRRGLLVSIWLHHTIHIRSNKLDVRILLLLASTVGAVVVSFFRGSRAAAVPQLIPPQQPLFVDPHSGRYHLLFVRKRLRLLDSRSFNFCVRGSTISCNFVRELVPRYVRRSGLAPAALFRCVFKLLIFTYFLHFLKQFLFVLLFLLVLSKCHNHCVLSFFAILIKKSFDFCSSSSASIGLSYLKLSSNRD